MALYETQLSDDAGSGKQGAGGGKREAGIGKQEAGIRSRESEAESRFLSPEDQESQDLIRTGERGGNGEDKKSEMAT